MTAGRGPIVVLMGVAGAGKTTVGQRLAELLAAPFHEGDVFHPPANVAKMSGGLPLDDADRLPWLAAIAAAIDRARDEGQGMVVACSALKRAYRDVLIGPRADVRLAYLRGTRDLIQARMDARRNHFMPAALLPSQFATLEEPVAAEKPIVVDVTAPPEALAARIAAALRQG
ncbi:MAG: gluconokinase [Alphaproteobacteria bacterium]|nr:gluconokinase [Alphaproteobacteria bacterium]